MAEGKNPPGPQPEAGDPIPDEALNDPLRLMGYLAERYGDVVRCPGPYGYSYLLNSPQYVRHFLHNSKWTRTELLKVALGDGSLSADGPPWKKRRRIIQPGFERARIEGFSHIMLDESLRLAGEWSAAVGVVDVAEEMMRLTVRIVARSLFSADVDEHIEALSEALTQVISDIGELTLTPFSVQVSFSPDRNRRLKASLKTVRTVVLDILDKRRAEPSTAWPEDLLTMLLKAVDDETGEGLDEVQLRDELVTMLVAGHETTATMLGWAWYLLSKNPQVEARWHQELEERFPDRDPTVDDLRDPSYTRDMVQEVLRLYPPVWTIARRVTEADVMDDWKIEDKSAIFICPYLLHRHPQHWPNPEVFDPVRFSPDGAKFDRYAYVPFLRGPHMCAGHHFATLEAQIILVTLGRRFTPRLPSEHVVKPRPLATLRFEGGLPMRIETRK